MDITNFIVILYLYNLSYEDNLQASHKLESLSTPKGYPISIKNLQRNLKCIDIP